LGYQDEGEITWKGWLTRDHKPESADEMARIVQSGAKVVIRSGAGRVVWNRPHLQFGARDIIKFLVLCCLEKLPCAQQIYERYM
jgi:hypothetical protein